MLRELISVLISGAATASVLIAEQVETREIVFRCGNYFVRLNTVTGVTRLDQGTT
jgi:hypothetical protein